MMRWAKDDFSKVPLRSPKDQALETGDPRAKRMGALAPDDDEDDEDLGFSMPTSSAGRARLWFLSALAGLGGLFLLLVVLIVDRDRIVQSPKSLSQMLPEDMAALVNANVDPCDDFYAFSCGQWLRETEIEPEKSSVYVGFTTVSDRNQQVLREIMKDNWPYLGELYGSCMNQTALNATGASPLQQQLKRIARVKSKTQLFKLAGALSKAGPDFLTGLGVMADAKDAATYALYASQTGLSLPDRQYYLDEDMFATVETEFRAYVSAMLTLAQWEPTKVGENQDQIVAFEQNLSSVFVPKEDFRDPTKTYNPMTIANATASYPLLLGAFLNGSRIVVDSSLSNSSDSRIIMETPSFFEAAETLVTTTPLSTLRTLLAFKYIQGSATLLSEPFLNATFAFYGRALTGQQQRSPRWKVCLSQVTSSFPNLVGKYYFLKQFDIPSEKAANDLVERLERTMHTRLNHVDWLDNATRVAAKQKLQRVTNLIGHSSAQEHFPFVLSTDELFTNAQTLARYQYDKAVARIGRLVDRSEWFMTASDVNAYYSLMTNQIVFPAGILQPPFFALRRHPARNFGAIGGIIGHELTHGFDNQGRYYDGAGNLASWWSDATETEFQTRTQCLVDQYDSFPVASAFNKSHVLGHVNGNFTLGENIADNGGVKLAFQALQDYLAGESDQDERSPHELDYNDLPRDQRLSVAEAEKLFFVSFAQNFCAKTTDAAMVRRLNSDPHSPEQWRINGVMMNSDDFAQVFSCPVGSRMNPEKKCQLW